MSSESILVIRYCQSNLYYDKLTLAKLSIKHTCIRTVYSMEGRDIR